MLGLLSPHPWCMTVLRYKTALTSAKARPTASALFLAPRNGVREAAGPSALLTGLNPGPAADRAARWRWR